MMNDLNSSEQNFKALGSAAKKAWYLVYTKHRQELSAITNLGRQGYRCYLPKIAKEVVRSGRMRRESEAIKMAPLVHALAADNRFDHSTTSRNAGSGTGIV